MNFSRHVKGNTLALSKKTRIDISELVRFLQSNVHITRVDLVECSIGKKVIEALVTGNLTNLTALHLKLNKIGPKSAKELAKLTNLTVLHLQGNNIGPEGGKALAKLTNLTSLNLCSCNIQDEGLEALALAKLTNLTSLDLSFCMIEDKGLEALIEALNDGKFPNLTVLHLQGNNIGPEGRKALAKLTNLTSLTSLNLHLCNIKDEGLEALALALAKLTNLTSLDLSFCMIEDKGLEALIEALNDGKFPNLTLVDVRDNNISAEVEKRLSDALESNKENALPNDSSKNVNTLPGEEMNGMQQSLKGPNLDNETKKLSAVVNGTSFPGTQNVTITPTNGVGQTGDLGSLNPVGNGTSGDDNSEPKVESDQLGANSGKVSKDHQPLNDIVKTVSREQDAPSIADVTNNEKELVASAANDHSDSRSISNNQSEDPESESAGSKQKESDTINNVGSLMHEEKTKTQLTRDLNQAKQYISILEGQVAQLQGKLNNVQQDLDEKISAVNTHDIESIQLTNKANTLAQERDRAQQEFAKITERLKGTEAELENSKKELDDANGKVSQLEQEKLSQHTKIDGLTREKNKLLSENNLLIKEKNPDLDNENKKLLAASAQSRKQVTYASVSLVLSGAFAVGASLTIPYLAICITLAVAASTFLAMGCYCSYKANTALSNVEIDRINGIDLVSSGSI